MGFFGETTPSVFSHCTTRNRTRRYDVIFERDNVNGLCRSTWRTRSLSLLILPTNPKGAENLNFL